MKTPMQELIEQLKQEIENQVQFRDEFEDGVVQGLEGALDLAKGMLEEEKEASHIGVVTKRLNWMVKEMDKAKPFSQSYNNLNDRHSRLLEAKKIFDKEGLWL